MNKNSHRRPQSAAIGKGARPKRKYTKNVEIRVNDVVSRLGKATTHFYMPIAQAKKAQDAKALGLDPAQLKEKEKEVQPGLRALRQKRAMMINQPEVTGEEIDEYFEKLDRRINEEKAEKKMIASQKEIYKAQQANQLLRYHEWLMLNRKGHTQAFKAITRGKKDSILDGSGIAQEPKPCPGQYNPRYNQVEKTESWAYIREEHMGKSVDARRRWKKTQDKNEQGIVCYQLIHALQHDAEANKRKQAESAALTRAMNMMMGGQLKNNDSDYKKSASTATIKQINDQNKNRHKHISTSQSGYDTIGESEDQIIFDAEGLQDLGLNLHHQPSFVQKELDMPAMMKRTSTFTPSQKEQKMMEYAKRMQSQEDVGIKQIKVVQRAEPTIAERSTENLKSDKQLAKKKSGDIDVSNLSNKTETEYLKKHRDVNLKDQQSNKLGSDQFLAFQNVRVGQDYYIVPTENPKNDQGDGHSKPIGLTIEKIANPSVAKRQPIKTVAYPMDGPWKNKLKNPKDKNRNPNDKNTANLITERQQMVIYPAQKDRRFPRDHDHVECADLPDCSLHYQQHDHKFQDTKSQLDSTRRHDHLHKFTKAPAPMTAKSAFNTSFNLGDSQKGGRLKSAKAGTYRSATGSQPMGKQTDRQNNWVKDSQTQADYKPNYASVEKRIGNGKLQMSQGLSRQFLPVGRPMNASNLIELPPDYSHSINPDQVRLGLSNLGHKSSKVISPNMSLNPARDLGFYRATEAIFNVIRDNENEEMLDQIQGGTQDFTNGLRCHGYNSIKDYISSIKLDETTAMESVTQQSPSRFRQSLNQNSSGMFRNSSAVLRNSGFPKRRPKTGNSSTHLNRNYQSNMAQQANMTARN